MTKLPWFRFYSEVINDRKIKRICRLTNQSNVMTIGFWAIILCMANDSPERGTLLFSDGIQVTDEDIIDEMGVAESLYFVMMDAFKSLNMISQGVDGTYYLPAWDKRQFKSDNVNERVKAWRDKQKVKRYSNVTGNNHVTDQIQIQNTDTEKEKDATKDVASRGENLKKPKKPNTRDAIRKHAESEFTRLTNLTPPMSNNRALGKLWYAPLREFCELAKWDRGTITQLLEKTYHHHVTENKLDYSSPNSFLKTYRMIAAQSTPRLNPQQKAEKLTREWVDGHIKQMESQGVEISQEEQDKLYARAE